MLWRLEAGRRSYPDVEENLETAHHLDKNTSETKLLEVHARRFQEMRRTCDVKLPLPDVPQRTYQTALPDVLEDLKLLHAKRSVGPTTQGCHRRHRRQKLLNGPNCAVHQRRSSWHRRNQTQRHRLLRRNPHQDGDRPPAPAHA